MGTLSYADGGMRCPTCGTENTPDSRFCGGCGAKQMFEGRVAPTAKISDDMPYPSAPPPTYPPGYVPVSQGPASIPPGGYAPRPASIPPVSGRADTAPPDGRAQGPVVDPRAPSGPRPGPAPVSSMQPHRHSAVLPVGHTRPSMSMPVVAARPRIGLIVFLLVVDLGLAGAGGVMLAKGLAKPDGPAKPAPTPPAANKVEAAAPAPAPPAATVGSGSAALEPVAPTIASGSAAAVAPNGSSDSPAAAKPRKKPSTTTATPIDPYEPEHVLSSEIDLQMTRDKPAFDHCQTTNATAHGFIHVRFQVQPDGHVAHAAASENTTGSASLATCLASTIDRWSFAIHPAQPVDFMRPFTYP